MGDLAYLRDRPGDALQIADRDGLLRLPQAISPVQNLDGIPPDGPKFHADRRQPQTPAAAQGPDLSHVG